jgi:predicted MPP superfamily phosphohydrolase
MVLRWLVFFGVLSTLTGLALSAVAHGLFPARFASPRALRRLRLGAIGVAMAMVLLELAARRLAPWGGAGWRIPLGAARLLMFGASFTALGVLVARVLVRLVPERAPAVTTAPAQTAPEAATELVPTRREALVRGATAAVGTAAMGAALVGNRQRLDLEVTELEVFIPDLPAALEGYTLVQLTDIHLGVFTGPREVDRLREVVARLRPEAVVLTGDILDSSPRHIHDGLRALSRIRGRRGTFAILGNHDHYTGPAQVLDGLRRTGIRPLFNEAVRVEGSDLLLVGVDDVMAPRMGSGPGPDLGAALRGHDPDAPVVLLAHNPVFFGATPARVKLQLSGHTHGGQVNLGPLVRSALPYVSGRYGRGDRTLYVSRGVGITGPPVRLGAAPEIVRVALTGRRTRTV